MSFDDQLQQYLTHLDGKMTAPKPTATTSAITTSFWPSCSQYHADALRFLGWRWKQELGLKWQKVWQEGQRHWQNLKIPWPQPIPALTLQQGPDRAPVIMPYETLLSQWAAENTQRCSACSTQGPERHIQRYQKMWQHYIQSLHEEVPQWQTWRQQVHQALQERKTQWQQHLEAEHAWYEQNWHERWRLFQEQRQMCEACFTYHLQQLQTCQQTLVETCQDLRQEQKRYEAQNPCLQAWSQLWHAYETLWQQQTHQWPQHVSLNQSLLNQLLRSEPDVFFLKQAQHLDLHVTYVLDYLRAQPPASVKPWQQLKQDLHDFLYLAQQEAEQYTLSSAYQFQVTLQKMCQETQQTLLQIKQQFEVAFQNLWSAALTQQTQLQQDEVVQQEHFRQAWHQYFNQWQETFQTLIQPVKASQPQLSEIIRFLLQYESECLQCMEQARQWQYQTWCLQQVGQIQKAIKP